MFGAAGGGRTVVIECSQFEISSAPFGGAIHADITDIVVLARNLSFERCSGNGSLVYFLNGNFSTNQNNTFSEVARVVDPQN